MIRRCAEHIRLSILSVIVVFFLTLNHVAYAQVLGTGDPIEPPIGRLVFGLLFCIFLAVCIIILMKKMKLSPRGSFKDTLFKRSQIDASDEISVRQTKRVSPHADVCLIAYGEKEFLVLISQNQFLVLDETPDISPKKNMTKGAV